MSRDTLREALDRGDEQVRKWAEAEAEAAARKDWSMADRWRYLAQGAAFAIEQVRAALEAEPVGLDGAFVAVLHAYADRAHDNDSYRALVPEHVLRDAAEVIAEYARLASQETGET